MPDLLVVTNQFVNGNPADGDEVNENFTDVKDYIDARLGNASSGQILVANASGVITPRTVSGDATLSNTGVLSLAANSVDSAEIANNAVGTTEIEDKAVTSRKVTLTDNMTIGSGTTLGLTAAYQDIPGMTMNLVTSVTSNFLVIATFDVEIASASPGDTADETVNVAVNISGFGDTVQKANCRVANAGLTSRMRWPITVVAHANGLAASTYTFKGKAKVETNEASTDTQVHRTTSVIYATAWATP